MLRRDHVAAYEDFPRRGRPRMLLARLATERYKMEIAGICSRRGNGALQHLNSAPQKRDMGHPDLFWR